MRTIRTSGLGRLTIIITLCVPQTRSLRQRLDIATSATSSERTPDFEVQRPDVALQASGLSHRVGQSHVLCGLRWLPQGCANAFPLLRHSLTAPPTPSLFRIAVEYLAGVLRGTLHSLA